MNLTKLFETQKILRDRINYNEEDRFNKLILALLVELGECANEWRGFKFWSVDQEPRVKVYKDFKSIKENEKDYTNPLLEEYVDGLHFVLELGIEIKVNVEDIDIWYATEKDATKQFINTYYLVSAFEESKEFYCYNNLISTYFELGETLGFTWEQIEEAYYKKNQINHDRQDNGY